MNNKQLLSKMEKLVSQIEELKEVYLAEGSYSEDESDLIRAAFRTTELRILIKDLKWNVRLEKNRSCPKCNSEDLAHERRPNGNSKCVFCGWTGKTKECED